MKNESVMIAITLIAIGYALFTSHVPDTDNQLTGAAVSSVASEHGTILREPTITADKINEILAAKGSPAAETGEFFIKHGEKYGIDPVFALAFYQLESNLGTAGDISRNARDIGNIRYSESEWCDFAYTSFGGSRWCGHNTWEKGIEHWFWLIKEGPYVPKGLDTVEEIRPVYAPSSDANVPLRDIKTINDFVTAHSKGAVVPVEPEEPKEAPEEAPKPAKPEEGPKGPIITIPKGVKGIFYSIKPSFKASIDYNMAEEYDRLAEQARLIAACADEHFGDDTVKCIEDKSNINFDSPKGLKLRFGSCDNKEDRGPEFRFCAVSPTKLDIYDENTKRAEKKNLEYRFSLYIPYCGDGEVNQQGEECDGGTDCDDTCRST